MSVFKWASSFNNEIAVILRNEKYDWHTIGHLINDDEEMRRIGLKSALRKELKAKYEERENNIEDLFEELKKSFKYKNMIQIKTGASNLIEQVPTGVIAILQRFGTSGIGSMSPELWKGLYGSLQVHDVAAASALLIIQTTVNIYRWFKGDITSTQAIKNMVTNGFTVISAGVGTGIGVAFATGTSLALAGGIVGGIVVGICGGLLIRYFMQRVMPDGPLEDFIEKRNIMVTCLHNLKCTESSSDQEVDKAYRIGCKLFHPQTAKKYDEKKWHNHRSSYVIVVTYRNTIQKAKNKLKFYPVNDSTPSEENDMIILQSLTERWSEISKEYDKYGVKIYFCKRISIKKEDLSDDEKDNLFDEDNSIINDSIEITDDWRKEQEEMEEDWIKSKEKELIKLEYYYKCLFIHYKNRTPKNILRRIFDFIDRPIPILSEQSRDEIALLDIKPTKIDNSI